MALMGSSCRIFLEAETGEGDTELELELHKPLDFKPGSYVFLMIPSVSRSVLPFVYNKDGSFSCSSDLKRTLSQSAVLQIEKRTDGMLPQIATLI